MPKMKPWETARRPRVLLYELALESHVPGDRLLRAIDRFVDLDACERT
jgi:transposase